MKFLNSSQKRFIIPVYQRNYNWKKEMLADIENTLNRKQEYNVFGNNSAVTFE